MTLEVFILLMAIVCILVLLAGFDNTVSEIPAKPRRLEVFQIRSSSNMADNLTYRVTAGAPVDGDVVSRVVTVTVNGESQGSVSYVGSTIDLGVITVPQDSDVEVSLVDIDDAGNASDPASYSFVAVDSIAPATPGALGVTLVGETTVSDVLPEVDVEPSSDETAG
jgi:hypothetical protein